MSRSSRAPHAADAADGGVDASWRWIGPTVRRVRLANVRSIAVCDVQLRPLTVLVGRNGAGKRTFVDALALVGEAMRDGLARALEPRGGIERLRRRSVGHPRALEITLDVRLPDWGLGIYGLVLAPRRQGGVIVRRERITLANADEEVRAHVVRGPAKVLESTHDGLPRLASPQMLLLPQLAPHAPFDGLYRTLCGMASYRFVPDALRALARPGDGARLASDGSNLPSVVERVARESPDAWRDVVETVATITDGLVAIEREALGPYETLCARRVVAGARHPWKFYASELSDGTLHALATLAAVHQDPRRRHGLSLAALSEPTAALHPAAVAALAGALQRAARHTQILATSHSPELIDALESASGAGVSQLAGLLLARIDDGVTTLADAAPPPGLPGAELGPPAGTLLREDRLRPRRRARRPIDQLDLFAPGDGVD